VHQHHPEFTQTSYLRIRAMEEAFPMRNYFASTKKATGNKIASMFGIQSKDAMTEHARSYGIQKIFDLHSKKDYKEETLFIACGIFDRYINMVGPEAFPKGTACSLATISVLMSAKLEQPISPSFTRMINLLNSDEKKTITKQGLIDLEADILIKLGFDFNFPGPMQSLERYLRILEYDNVKNVFEMGYQICKFSLNEAKFLEYRPSQIAACSALIAISIFKEEEDPTFFKNSSKKNLRLLNTDIWNNESITDISGYSIIDLKDCLFNLSDFIAGNLSPNRLKNFDIEAIKSVETYSEIPKNLKLNLSNLK